MTRNRLLKRLANVKTYRGWLRILTNTINRVEKYYSIYLNDLSRHSSMVGVSAFACFLRDHKQLMLEIPEFKKNLNEFKIKIKQPLDRISIHSIVDTEEVIITRLNWILDKLDKLYDTLKALLIYVEI